MIGALPPEPNFLQVALAGFIAAAVITMAVCGVVVTVFALIGWIAGWGDET